MKHLSRFLIGIRHNRLFRVRDLSGELIDNFLKVFPDKFTLVGAGVKQANDEFILRNANDNLSINVNLDDIILESKKLFDWESKKYVEINKGELIEMGSKSLPILIDILKTSNDFIRIGLVFEFRIPKWEYLSDSKFGLFIAKNFISYNTPEESNEGSLRFSYKLRVPGGGAVSKLEDYRNVIIRIEESKGINESGKEEKCLFVSTDIQRIFKPLVKDVDINEHFKFADEHLKSVVLSAFKDKGVEINYE